MITILYVVSTLERSGPTNQLLGIIKGIDRTRYHPVILTLSPEPKQTQSDTFVSANATVLTLGLSRIQMHISGRKKLLEIVNELCPNIIHSCGLRPDLYCSRYLKEYRRMATVRCRLEDVYISYYGYFIGKIVFLLHKVALDQMDRIVACSSSVGNYLQEQCNCVPVVIRNGVDDFLFNRASHDIKSALRKKFDIPQDAFVFITSGHLSKLKDPLTAIRGFKQAFHSDCFRYILLGDGLLRDTCLTEADSRVLLPGRVDNVSEWLKTADAYISASHMEGMPNSVLEAMASGLPVILSDIAAHKEILNISGTIGFLFRTGNEADLSDALRRLLDSDIGNMSSCAMAAIESEFGFKSMSKKYQKEYFDLEGEPHSEFT